MKRVMLTTAAQITFFYYFMMMSPPEHLWHLLFDRIFDSMILVTMVIGVLINMGCLKDAVVSVLSPPISIGIIGIVLRIIWPLMFAKEIFTFINITAFYVTLAVIWFGMTWVFKRIVDRCMPE